MTVPNGVPAPGAPLIPLPPVSVDVEQVRRYAWRCLSAASELRQAARGLAVQCAGIPGFWRSVPSSGRAAARLDALSDLLRSQADRCTALQGPLSGFADAAATAVDAVVRANADIASYNRALPTPTLAQQVLATSSRRQGLDAVAALATADRRCTDALHAFSSGEGRGSGAVTHRVHEADVGADATPDELAAAIRTAAHSGDLAALEVLLRALNRMRHTDSQGAAHVVDAAGSILQKVPGTGTTGTGWDGRQMGQIVAAAFATRAAVHGWGGHLDDVPPGRGGTRRPATGGSGATSTPGRAGSTGERMRPGPTSPAPAPRQSGSGTSVAAPGTRLPVAVARVVAAGRAGLGRPYVFAASGPCSYDCSGLTLAAWRAAGVTLPHDAAAQYGVGHHVPLAAAQPGDLVFWSDSGRPADIHHVALYLGDGRVLEASTPGTVVHVRTLGAHEPGLLPTAARPAEFPWSTHPAPPTPGWLAPAG